MSTSIAMAFAKGASAFRAYLESPHGRLRQEIVADQAARLIARTWGPDPPSLRVLDVGCGTADVALRLAAAGHGLSLLDPVPEMLAFARESAQALTPPPAIPPRFIQGSLEEAPALLTGQTFDLLLCHTLLEYLGDPYGALRSLAPLLARGGCLSLVALNRRQEPLRAAIRDAKLDEARTKLTAEGTTDSLFGLPRTALVLEELRHHLSAVGIAVVEHEGILVFADYLAPGPLEEPSRFRTLFRLEVEAGALSPFREVARYLHCWGRRAAPSGGR